MIIFRADGNPIIGLGHVMRNLSIADAFRNAGEQCCFILADDGLSDLIKSRGHGVKVLNIQFDHMDEKMDMFRAAAGGKDVKAVFVDSYYVTERYLKTLHGFCREKGITLVYVDDVLKFPYSCDVLVNYNIYASEYNYKKLYKERTAPELILGTAYALLYSQTL